MNQYNTIGFHPGNSRIHQLNATVANFLFLLVVSISAMVTYDTRYLILISVSSILLFKYAHIEWKQVRFVVKFILFFHNIKCCCIYIDPGCDVKLSSPARVNQWYWSIYANITGIILSF